MEDEDLEEMRALRGKNKQKYSIFRGITSTISCKFEHFYKFFYKLYVAWSKIKPTMLARSQKLINIARMYCEVRMCTVVQTYILHLPLFFRRVLQIHSISSSCSHFSPATEPRTTKDRQDHTNFRGINTSGVNGAFEFIIKGQR